MSASSYGIIVEGTYDSVVYEVLIRRLTSPGVHIKPLSCDGKTNLMRNFPGLLRRFEYEIGGKPVDMAIVIRDADGKDTGEVEAKMRMKIQGRNYPFRLDVRFFAVPQAMDAWLLADVGAISAAVQGRDGKPVTKSHDDPEALLDPKEWLRKLLTDHKAAYTAELCREIAQKTDLQLLSQRCRSFPAFAELVDC
jgi:hypothetical protein